MSSRLNPRLLTSRQYLTLDLLEGICAHAMNIAGTAFDKGEDLSDEELFQRVFADMACNPNELADLRGILEGARAATNPQDYLVEVKQETISAYS